MRRFRNIFFALAAFLWLPASVHCELETIPGLEFLQCAAAGPATGDASRGCHDCGCCGLEKSQFNQTSQERILPPSPVVPPDAFMPRLITEKTLPEEVSTGILTAAPPQLIQRRHFVSRTSLPARPPTLAS